MNEWHLSESLLGSVHKVRGCTTLAKNGSGLAAVRLGTSVFVDVGSERKADLPARMDKGTTKLGIVVLALEIRNSHVWCWHWRGRNARYGQEGCSEEDRGKLHLVD